MRKCNLGGDLISDESYPKPLKGLLAYKNDVSHSRAHCYESNIRYNNSIYHSHAVLSSHSTLLIRGQLYKSGEAPNRFKPDQALQKESGI